MAIICPKCKRQYDVTLFQLGNVVECDCGERIKLGPRKGIVLEMQNEWTRGKHDSDTIR